MQRHPLLGKQIKKWLHEQHLKDEAVIKFLTVVNNAYENFERHKKIADHAFEVSEKEYREVTRRLQQQNVVFRESVIKLKEAIRSLTPDESFQFDDTGNN